jgi:hypothetical protein
MADVLGMFPQDISWGRSIVGGVLGAPHGQSAPLYPDAQAIPGRPQIMALLHFAGATRHATPAHRDLI